MYWLNAVPVQYLLRSVLSKHSITMQSCVIIIKFDILMHENLVIFSVKYKFVLQHYLVSAKIPFFKGQCNLNVTCWSLIKEITTYFFVLHLPPFDLLLSILLPIIMRRWALATNLYLRQRKLVQYVIQRNTLQRRWMDLFTFVSCQITSVRSVGVKTYFLTHMHGAVSTQWSNKTIPYTTIYGTHACCALLLAFVETNSFFMEVCRKNSVWICFFYFIHLFLFEMAHAIIIIHGHTG